MIGARASSPVGYRHPAYAQAFHHLGPAHHLPTAGAWVLERPLPSHLGDAQDLTDLAAPYPLLVGNDVSAVRADLEDVAETAVSFVAVTDPFDSHNEHKLSRDFDHCQLFKKHYMADLTQPVESFIRTKRLRHAEEAERVLDLSIERGPLSETLISECWTLYDGTMHRLGADGPGRFPQDVFTSMLRVPGAVAFVARHDGEAVGMQIDYQDGDFVYAHVAAVNDLGRQLRAATAINVRQVLHYQGTAAWIDSGAAPGGLDDSTHGLATFKQAFSNTSAPVYLCGAILRPDDYHRLSAASGESWFPAYRAPRAADPQPAEASCQT